MGDWSLGSVASAVMDLVPDVPTAISGTRLLEIADRKRQFVSEYTGDAIGSNSITITHQDIIVNLTAAQTLKGMLLTGTDNEEVRLGDLTIRKGAGGAVTQAIKQYEQDAMEQLKLLGKNVTTYQTFYG